MGCALRHANLPSHRFILDTIDAADRRDQLQVYDLIMDVRGDRKRERVGVHCRKECGAHACDRGWENATQRHRRRDVQV